MQTSRLLSVQCGSRAAGWSPLFCVIDHGLQTMATGQMRPSKPFHPPREAILSLIEKQYIYEAFVDLAECM